MRASLLGDWHQDNSCGNRPEAIATAGPTPAASPVATAMPQLASAGQLGLPGAGEVGRGSPSVGDDAVPRWLSA